MVIEHSSSFYISQINICHGILPDYNRIGHAVSGSIGWNSLRLFLPDRFDPTARLSGHIFD